MTSVAYSPNGRHIISGSGDRTIRIWDAETCDAVGNALEGHTHSVSSAAYSSDGQHVASGLYDNTIRVLNTFLYTRILPSSHNPIYSAFFAKPGMDGWVRDSEGGLLYWVPHDCRTTVHSPALLTIPLTSRNRSISLDFDDIAFGTSWIQIFKSAPS